LNQTAREIFGRAVEAYRARRPEEAESLCRQILASEAGNFDAHLLLGALHRERGAHEAALASYERALAARPGSGDAHFNRGNTLRALGRLEEALASYDRALALRPQDPEALNNRGVALNELDRPEEALAAFERALALRPAYAEALNNRGIALQRLGRLEEALASYDRARALRPGFADAVANRVGVLRLLRAQVQEQDRQAEAAKYFEAAIAENPDDAEAHWNLSLALLALGDYERGWREYEWRWRNPALNAPRRESDKPLWLGGEPIAGKTLLVHPEQGFGDAIQMVRYVPLLAARGARVVLICHRDLRRLFGSVEPTMEVIGLRDGNLPAFDCHIPMMSLPLAFGTTLETIPADVPYLAAPTEQVLRWRERLAAHGAGRRLGLVWSGNPEFSRAEKKACPPERLAPLLDRRGWRFFSLQKGAAAAGIAQLDPAGGRIVDFSDELADFRDTAALVSALDLVITVDTAVAHLAGALGKPVWVLLPFNADWRWLRGRSDSPWYPSARLFRQAADGGWAGVIDAVVQALESAP